MQAIIVTADGRNLAVEVLPYSDDNSVMADSQKKIDSFIVEHRSHKILEHNSHKVSRPIRYEDDPDNDGWIIQLDFSNEVWHENYEILECAVCGKTQDTTNGDFILLGLNISKGENPIVVLTHLMKQDLGDKSLSKIEVIKSLRHISLTHPQLIKHFGYNLDASNGEQKMLSLSDAKLFSEQILGF